MLLLFFIIVHVFCSYFAFSINMTCLSMYDSRSCMYCILVLISTYSLKALFALSLCVTMCCPNPQSLALLFFLFVTSYDLMFHFVFCDKYVSIWMLLLICYLTGWKEKNKWSLRILPSGRPLRAGVRKGGWMGGLVPGPVGWEDNWVIRSPETSSRVSTQRRSHAWRNC